MRMAFLNSPCLASGHAVEAEDCCWGRVTRVLPSMLLSCATEAQAAGHEVCYIDLSIPWQLKVAHSYAPEVIVYPLAWQYHKEVHDILTEWFPKRYCRRVVLAVPPGYSDAYDELIPKPALVIRSEPESVMGSLPLDVSNDAGWERLRLARYKVWPNRLHLLKPIDYSLVPSNYWPSYTSACYQVTRGCPYHCCFCVWGGSTITDRTFRMRPAAQVAQNLNLLRCLSKESRGGDGLPLYLLAAQLTTSKEWLLRFSDHMVSDPYYFQGNVNLGEVTQENVQLLKKAGMASVSAGLEATSDRMLKVLGKPYDLDRAIKSILILQDNFGRIRLHIRTGFGETDGDILEALCGLKHMKACGVRSPRVDLAPLVHYRGTMIRDRADYPLEQLAGYDVESLVMANQPVEWEEYADELRSYGWFTKWGLSK